MPLTKSELTRLDAIQRQMLRSMVGWVHILEEDWRDTVVQMLDEVHKCFEKLPHGELDKTIGH